MAEKTYTVTLTQGELDDLFAILASEEEYFTRADVDITESAVGQSAIVDILHALQNAQPNA